ncbi:MAG: DUF1456 family protein [Flammeovirgaceae bacterium]
MKNNDILRRLRYTFDFNDTKMIELFDSGALTVNRSEVSNWLKREDDEEFEELYDVQLAAFLNGFINDKRGKREGVQPKPEKSLNNNTILRKLKIALNLKDEDMVEVLALADLRVSKHEINAFFRKPTQKQYRVCKDQILRNFLHGLQLKYRPE